MATYTIKKKLVSVGRDYDVHDESDTAVFEIDGKVRFARTFDVKDRTGQVRYAAKEKLLSIDQTFLIDAGPAGEITVRRTTSASVYPMEFDIGIGGETRMRAQGSFFADGVNITRESTRIATVSREQYTVIAEIFHLSVEDGEDVALLLAIAMVIVEGDPSRGVVS